MAILYIFIVLDIITYSHKEAYRKFIVFRYSLYISYYLSLIAKNYAMLYL